MLLVLPVAANSLAEGLSQRPETTTAPDAIQPSAPVQPGQTVILQEEGTLSPGGPVLPDDSLFEQHIFEGTEGQTVNILMESNQFNTYLILVDPVGQVLSYSNDVDPTSMSSELTVTLPNSGFYRVIANAFEPTGQGDYIVTIKEVDAQTSGE